MPDDLDQLIDSALDAAAGLPTPPAFRAWCNAYRAGRSEEEAVKRVYRTAWEGLAERRFDDFMRVIVNAETRVNSLEPDQILSWTQAAAARAVLELIQSRRRESSEAMREQQTRAGDIAAAALRFAEAARRRGARGTVRATCLR